MKIINTTSINQARRQIDSLKAKAKPVIVLSQGEEFNRKILENKKVSMLIINEEIKIKDHLKQRSSGLNEFMCKLAAKNEIKIAVDISKIVKKSDVEKARSLSRLSQNIMLCKKSGCELVFLGKAANKKALQSLFLSLGASTSQASNCILADADFN